MAESLTEAELLAPTPEEAFVPAPTPKCEAFTAEQLEFFRGDKDLQAIMNKSFPAFFAGDQAAGAAPVAVARDAVATAAERAAPVAREPATVARDAVATVAARDAATVTVKRKTLPAAVAARVSDIDLTAASNDTRAAKRAAPSSKRGVPAQAFMAALEELDETFSKLQALARTRRSELETTTAKCEAAAAELTTITSMKEYALYEVAAAKAVEVHKAETHLNSLKAAQLKAETKIAALKAAHAAAQAAAQAAVPGEDLAAKANAARAARGELAAESQQLKDSLAAAEADIERGKRRGDLLNMSNSSHKRLLVGLCGQLPAAVTKDAADEVATLAGAIPYLSLPVFQRVQFESQQLVELDEKLLGDKFFLARSAADLVKMARTALSAEEAALVERHAAVFMQSRAWHAKEASRFLAQKKYEVTEETRAAAARLVSLAPLAPGERVLGSEAAKKRKMLFDFAAQSGPNARAIVDIMTVYQSDSIVLFDGEIIPGDPWGEWIA